MKAVRTPLATALVVVVIMLNGCGVLFNSNPGPDAPSFDPRAGTYNEHLLVSIETRYGQLYVTTDPDASVLEFKPTSTHESIFVGDDLTIRAYVLDDNGLRSAIAEAAYIIEDAVAPVISSTAMWQASVDYFGYDIRWDAWPPDGSNDSNPSDDLTEWKHLEFAVYVSPADDIDTLEDAEFNERTPLRDWFSRRDVEEAWNDEDPSNDLEDVGHAYCTAAYAGERRYINVFVRDLEGNVSAYGSVGMASLPALDVYVASFVPMDNQDDQIWMNPADYAYSPIFTQETVPPVSPFLEDTYAVAMADLDGDGYDDLIACYENLANPGVVYQSWFKALGNGTFDSAPTHFRTSSDICDEIEIVDVDRDGSPDVVFANRTVSEIEVFDADASLLFTVPVTGTDRISMGDFNADGYPDIATCDFGIGVRLWKNGGGTGVTEAIQSWPGETVTDPTDVLLEDLDEDGDADLVVSSSAGKVEIYHSNGYTTFVPETGEDLWWGAEDTRCLAATDWDDDGRTDLIFGNDTSVAFMNTRLYRNDEFGGYALADWADSGMTESVALSVADMNGDNRPDLVELINGLGFKIWLNDGFGGIDDGFASGGPSGSLAIGRLR